jgi:hypothetical protein
MRSWRTVRRRPFFRDSGVLLNLSQSTHDRGYGKGNSISADHTLALIGAVSLFSSGWASQQPGCVCFLV